MKKARRWIVSVFMVLVLVNLDSPVFAFDNRLTRRTLQGLQGVIVVVASLGPEIKQDGLTEDQLRTDTELKLRMAGIKVLSNEELSITPGKPMMHVYITILKTKLNHYTLYVFSISLQIMQEASLARAPNIKTAAITWLVDITGKTGELEDIRDSTKDLVDKFINAYLSVNSK
jgi:hypothetical protein